VPARAPEEDVEPFTPLAHLCGNPKLLEAALERVKMDEIVKEVTTPEALAEGDMEPIISLIEQRASEPEPSPLMSWEDFERLRRQIDIDLYTEDPDKPPPIPVGPQNGRR